MKKILFLVVTLIIAMSTFTCSFAITSNKDVLNDIEETKYEDAVKELIELNIVTGYPDNTYRPDKKVTRAEMAKLLVVAAGLEDKAIVSNGTTNFIDVEASHWASGFINVASAYGYIKGYPEKTFEPNENVTYAEAITMAIRVLGYGDVVDKNGEWPHNYINKAKSLRMLEELAYDEYTDNASRGEIAILVWNMLKTTKSYYLVGVVEEVFEDKLDEFEITISDETYAFKKRDNKDVDIEKYKDGVIFYLLRKNLKEETVRFESGLTIDEIFDDENMTDYIEASDGTLVAFEKMGTLNIGKAFKDKFDDNVFIKVYVDDEEKTVDYIDFPKMVSSVEASDFEKGDRLYVDIMSEVTYIISGLEEK